MLGTMIGDIAGSVYEFKNCRRKDFGPFFHAESKFTDDTICVAAIADALVHQIHPAKALKAWGRRYEDNGGWGRSFFLWLASDDDSPYGSFGNGGAMRVAPVGLLASSLDEAISLSDYVTAVTHNHPEGMNGAAAVAVCIYLARTDHTPANIRHEITARFGYDLSKSVDELRVGYRHSERAVDTVPQAITAALEAINFEDAIRNAISLGGDSDTIAAMAGGIAEARFGLPEEIAAVAWSKLPLDIQATMRELYAFPRLHPPIGKELLSDQI